MVGEQNKKLEGIGGWLLIYTLFTFLLILASIIFLWKERIGGIEEWWFVTLIPVFGLIVLVFLLIKKNIAKNLNISFVWFLVLIPTIMIAIILRQVIFGTEVSLSDSRIGLAIAGIIFLSILIPAFIWAIIWTIYFRKSERVKNTLVN